MMILQAARLEMVLRRASMPSKGARTSLEAHFSESFVNASILKYTTVLSEGREPNFQMLLTLPPPKDYQPEPTRAGIPRRWGNPWVKKKNHEGATKTEQETLGEEENTEEPILRMAPSAENPIECVPQVTPGPDKTSLLGYFWNTHQDVLSTNKKEVLNLHSARRGVRPESCNIHEASDLLRLHQIKPLKHRQALSAAHSLYDPVQAARFLSAQLKFMYR